MLFAAASSLVTVPTMEAAGAAACPYAARGKIPAASSSAKQADIATDLVRAADFRHVGLTVALINITPRYSNLPPLEVG
jgi:hypothetical protein